MRKVIKNKKYTTEYITNKYNNICFIKYVFSSKYFDPPNIVLVTIKKYFNTVKLIDDIHNDYKIVCTDMILYTNNKYTYETILGFKQIVKKIDRSCLC